MKTWTNLFALILSFILTTTVLIGQTPSPSPSVDLITPEVLKAQEAVNKVLFDSGVSFREGLLAYQDKHFSVAGEKFNKSVEAFIYSTINIHREPKLLGCYNQLIETIYRIEFPSENRLPQIMGLVQTCNWNNLEATTLNIDNALADRITNLSKSQITKPSGLRWPTVTPNTTNTPNAEKISFSSQEFEPSPLDELAKLELTTDEKQIEDNPVAQKQSQYIQYARSPKSGGFIVVKAKAGDTVTRLAQRHRVNAIEVAKLNGLLPNTPLSAGREVKIPALEVKETWQNISNRTGVSVADLMAANPGMKTPRGKVFVPIRETTVNNVVYSRPTNLNSSSVAANVKIVRARAGETVAKVAQRSGVDATEVAKYNGLLTNTVLSAGREVKIPSTTVQSIQYSRPNESICKISTPPVIQNLRLGMTAKDASQALQRKVVLRKKPYSIYDDDAFYWQASRSKGVKSLYLSFYKGKLYWINAAYDNSIKWDDLDEFQEAVSKVLQVPNRWMSGDTSRERKLKCDGFNLGITRTYSENYELWGIDTIAVDQMISDWKIKRDRKINEQNKKKASFKP